MKCGYSAAAFTARGFAQREFFPHRAVAIRKQYPDAFLLLERRGVSRKELGAGVFYQINVYSDHLAGFPEELFTDRRINWHNQQLGEKGMVAAAGLYVLGSVVEITVMQSDLCQQLFRHSALKRLCKTQIEKRFGYWYRILFNAVLDLAVDLGLAAVLCPTSGWMHRSTKKHLQPDLFRRIYDSPGKYYFSHRVNRGRAEYWEVDLAANAHRIVRLPAEGASPVRGNQGTRICLFHDIEENVDTEVSASECRENLASMLEIERSHGVAATYNIVAKLFEAKQESIWASNGRHALAFHSYNHDMSEARQLARCRQVDQQVRGYRPSRSVITRELTDYGLSYYNFEWLASGRKSLGVQCCTLQNGIVKIPVLMDEYGVVTGQMDYSEWERRLLALAPSEGVVAFGLHDCYGRVWLRSFPALLDKLSSMGSFMTADEICDAVFWEQGNAALSARTGTEP